LLTADLVHVRRRGDRLQVVPLADGDRPRALELAGVVVALVRAHVGLQREALLEAWSQVAVAPGAQRLARGLWKLALDACAFEENTSLDPVGLRRQLFLRAAARRRAGHPGDRDGVLADLAREHGVSRDAIDEAMYADLPGAHVLRRADLPSPAGLLAAYELQSHQAILLRATQLQARVWNARGSAYRALFRTLKFRRLLYRITASEPRAHGRGGYAIDIDGPMSLFEQTTKYGLNLALALPAIMECDAWEVRADLRWGKERRPLRYHHEGGRASATSDDSAALPDEVATLLADLRQQNSPWAAAPSEAILSLPGVGVCVPDLEFVHRATGQHVFLEVLGFWSRAAVWKRIEMAAAGLPVPVVFAVSKHLRVSEEALPADTPAALYVYARNLNARAVLDRVEAVASAARAHESTEG
jgi:predicted nuclease of restriction endonuclease-like RecB superfamily